MAANDEDAFCGVCKKKINLIKENYLKCKNTNCGKHYHKSCSKISETNFVKYQNCLDKEWFCGTCSASSSRTTRSKNANSPIIAMSPVQKINCEVNNKSEDNNTIECKSDNTNLLNELNNKMDMIIKQNSELCKKFDLLSEKYIDLEKCTKQLISDNKHLKSENIELKNMINNITFKFNDIEQEKLINDVQLSGIPKMQNEDLKKIFLTLCNKVNSDIKDVDIIGIYRKNTKTKANKEELPGPIVIKLSTTAKKIDLLSKCKKIKGFDTSILNADIEKRPFYVGDHVTGPTLFLYAKAKELLNTKKLSFVWIQNGNVLVKRVNNNAVIKISNLIFLNELIK